MLFSFHFTSTAAISGSDFNQSKQCKAYHPSFQKKVVLTGLYENIRNEKKTNQNVNPGGIDVVDRV